MLVKRKKVDLFAKNKKNQTALDLVADQATRSTIESAIAGHDASQQTASTDEDEPSEPRRKKVRPAVRKRSAADGEAAQADGGGDAALNAPPASAAVEPVDSTLHSGTEGAAATKHKKAKVAPSFLGDDEEEG